MVGPTAAPHASGCLLVDRVGRVVDGALEWL
jgi:hypothetical protein